MAAERGLEEGAASGSLFCACDVEDGVPNDSEKEGIV